MATKLSKYIVSTHFLSFFFQSQSHVRQQQNLITLEVKNPWKELSPGIVDYKPRTERQ